MEEDIKRCNELIKEEHANWIGISNQKAIENLIKEFKKIKIENIKYQLGQLPDTTEDYKTLKKELEIWKNGER